MTEVGEAVSRLDLLVTQGVPGLPDKTEGSDTLPSPVSYFPTVSAVGMQLFEVGGGVALDSYSIQFSVGSAPEGSVNLSGSVRAQDGSPLCAMVLASGQFMFSCDPDGPFSLTNLPRENDGTVRRQVYANGFFPRIDVLDGSVDETVVLARSGVCPNYNPPTDPGDFPDSAGKRIDIPGEVLMQNTQTPVCALVLANGQHMFSCDGWGEYALNIPLDDNGQFEVQVYAEGFAPTVQKFDEFSPINDVRMARASECQQPPSRLMSVPRSGSI